MLHRYEFTYHAQPSRGQVLQAAPLLPIPALSRVRTTERDQSKDISTCHALGKKKKKRMKKKNKEGAFRAVASPRLPPCPSGCRSPRAQQGPGSAQQSRERRAKKPRAGIAQRGTCKLCCYQNEVLRYFMCFHCANVEMPLSHVQQQLLGRISHFPAVVERLKRQGSKPNSPREWFLATQPLRATAINPPPPPEVCEDFVLVLTSGR